ncbi:MAG: OmpA family protein [Treponema sp.]|nr:OmpA family protein [Treponema sp.]
MGLTNNVRQCLVSLFLFPTLVAGLQAQGEPQTEGRAAEPVPYQRFWSLDGGLSTNYILVDGISFGLVLDPRFALSPHLMLGSKNLISFSSDDIVALESQAYLRWNFLRPRWRHIDNLFLQAGVGILAAYRGSDVTRTRGSVLFDGTLGASIPLNASWHIEPSVRVGYPFISGISVTVGRKFPFKQHKVEVVRTLPAEEVVRRIVITQVEYVLFGPDLAEYNSGIDGDAMALNDLVLAVVAQTLKDNAELLVRIEGHANPVTGEEGELEDLLRLSRSRAEEVGRLLGELGVRERQIVVIGHGSARVLARDHDHWNVNRRVELIIKQFDEEADD